MSGINRLKNMGAAGQRAAAVENRAYQSGHQVVNETPCYILRMFDPYTLAQTDDKHVSSLTEGKTGYLYVEVKEITSGVIRVLPLDVPADFVYLVYGNGQQIAGTAAKILYTNSDKNNAFVKLAPNPEESYPDLGDNAMGVSYDVGYLFGGF